MITPGILYVISAPSGAGKSSLIKSLLKIRLFKNIYLSVSYTTRSMRTGEKHGKNYFFISKKDFKRMISKNLFLEYAKVFGNYYGTLHKTVKEMIISGTDVLLDIDQQGARQIRKKNIDFCSIFILPPSIGELNKRLKIRGQDSKKSIIYRITEAANEINYFREYDYLILNNNFYNALTELKIIFQAEKLRVKHQKLKYSLLIDKLTKNNNFY